MTFSIAGFCRETVQFGAATSSSSIYVASRCVFTDPKKGVVLTQNVTNPVFGQLEVQLLQERLDPENVLARLRDHEKCLEWRQLQVLDARGCNAVYSGAETLDVYATQPGDDCVAGGDMLADEVVINTMVAAFKVQSGELAGRLLVAMEQA